MSQPTTRIRLYDGPDDTHAVKPGITSGHRTTCDVIVHWDDHWLPNTAVVTCPACKRALAKEA